MATMDDIERGIVGAVLMRPARVVEALEGGCRAAWFVADAASLCWSAIDALWRRGEIEGLTEATLLAEVKRLAAAKDERRDASALTVDYLAVCVERAPVADLAPSLRLLKNAAMEREAKRALAEKMGALEMWADYTDGLLETRDALDKILDASVSDKKIPARAVLDAVMAEYDEAHKMRVAEDGPRDLHWTPGLKMPWPKMTEFLNGLRPGLHVVAARPSVGKTAFAVNLMRFWCETGYGVLFCSLDMPRTEVLRRFIAEKARVSARKAAFSPTRTDLDAMRRAVDDIAAWPLIVVETRDVDDLRTVAKINHAAGRVKVIVVDYLQLLHARALAKEDAVEYARVSYVSDALKRLANDLQVPVFALAQLNRESTKGDNAGRMPGLADLRGSGAIEQDAFTVAILHRDAGVVEKWKKGEDIERAMRLIPGTLENPHYKYGLEDLDPIWWVLCKAQNGPTGVLPFLVRKKYFAWMLADWKAQANEETVGYGSTQRKVIDHSPNFERVHSDWRHDPLEETLRLQLALIQDGEDVANIEEGA